MEVGRELMPPNLEKKVLAVRNIKNFSELDDIRSIGESEEVQMGECLLLRKNDNLTSYSYGAGPCVSGIIQTNDNKLYLFHSVANETTPEQKEIIKNAKKGVVGCGRKESSDTFRLEFKNKNIKVITSPGEDYDFNIVFVKAKNKFNVSPGIYFCYDQLK